MQRSAGLGTLLVLGLGFSLLRSPQVSPGAPRSTARSAAATERTSSQEPEIGAFAKFSCDYPACIAKDLLDTISAFSGVDANDTPKTTLVEAIRHRSQKVNPYYSVAIVPDPVHTHLGLFTDRTMDAIQQGAQQAGWIFDRAWLPWDAEEHPESTDFRIRVQQEDYKSAKEDIPGLVIFRRVLPPNEAMNRPLFVFVVGETPTGGFNKTQFQTALQVTSPDSNPLETLRIIGPTFSGSLYSLSEVLKTQNASGIVIRSGTVSSESTIRWFLGKGLRVDFATFQQSDDYMICKFLEFEDRKGYSKDKIAILTEDETAYGNVGRSDPNRDPSGPPSEACDHGALHLYFPRNISQLRSAYQHGVEQTSSAGSDSYQIRSTLPLNLQDTGSDDDTVPQFSHSQTPLSQEAILIGIVAAIRKGHIKFVVLKATNPMDTVFLSAFLKKGYSDARVVAMPADLLLSRDVDDVSLLHGVMALTTYSLLPGIDEQNAAAATRAAELPRTARVFPAAYSAGVFNAALSQMTCIGAENKSGCGYSKSTPTSLRQLPPAPYTEYVWPTIGGPVPQQQNPFAPVAWLTVLARDGFWPMAVLDSNKKATNRYQPSTGVMVGTPSDDSGKSSRFSIRWPLFWGLICGSVLLLAAAYWHLLHRGSIRNSSSAMSLLAAVQDPHRSAMIVTLGLLLLCVTLLMAWPWAILGKHPWENYFYLGMALAVAAFLCWTTITELRYRKAPIAIRNFLIGAFLLVTCFLLVYLVGGHLQYPFLYRYVHVASGVSPLLPFLCLVVGGLWWAWFSLSGLTLIDKRRPCIPTKEDYTAIGSTGHKAPDASIWIMDMEGIRHIVKLAKPATFDDRVFKPALALFVLSAFAVDFSHPISSLETEHFEWIYGLSVALVTFVLLCTLFRSLVLWLELKRILSALDRLPLRRAFSQLRFAWQPIWRLGAGRWQDLYRFVSRQLETLEHLQRELQEDAKIDEDPDRNLFLTRIQETFDQQNQIRTEYAAALAGPTTPAKKHELSNYVIDLYQQLQLSIARTCAAAGQYLDARRTKEEAMILCEVGSDGLVEKDDDAPEIPLTTRLAERFVALVYLNFILNFLLRIRTLAIAAGGLYIFLLLSVNSYPFEPRIALRSLGIIVLILVVGMVGYVFAQMHRDSIISLVTQTTPGELGVEFWLRMASFVALPLISLLVSQFPSLNNAVFSWLEPAANALK